MRLPNLLLPQAQMPAQQRTRLPIQIHIPHTEISSYQSEYIKHPINTWKKPPPES
jgi:hypothetical protein